MKRPYLGWGDRARPVTVEIWVHFQASVCKILVGAVALGQVFLRVLRLYPVSVIRHCSIHTPFVRSLVHSFVTVTVDIKYQQMTASLNNSLKL